MTCTAEKTFSPLCGERGQEVLETRISQRFFKGKSVSEHDRADVNSSFVAFAKILAKQAEFEGKVPQLKKKKHYNQLDFLRWETRLNPIFNKLDCVTKLHSINVYRIAQNLAMRANLSHEEMHELKFCALFHDIGKADPKCAKITTNPNASKEEVVFLKRNHTMMSCVYMNEHDVAQEVIDHAVKHHESWMDNGTSLITDIISIADSFDAMITNRGYNSNRVKTDLQATIEILVCAEKQFNPDLSVIFLNLQIENRFEDKNFLKEIISSLHQNLSEGKISTRVYEKILESRSEDKNFLREIVFGLQENLADEKITPEIYRKAMDTLEETNRQLLCEIVAEIDPALAQALYGAQAEVEERQVAVG